MLLDAQLASVHSRALASRASTERRVLARRRMQRQRQRFFGNPVNLLLPLAAGALVGARMSAPRRPAGSTPRRSTFGTSLRTALSLWTATRGLRESILSSGPAADAASRMTGPVDG